MKTKPSVGPLCSDCQVIRRKRRSKKTGNVRTNKGSRIVKVICRKNPRHKQTQG